MAISTWVYRKADAAFMRGGFYDPSFDPLIEGVVQFPDADPHPDPRLHRFDAVLGKRPATQAEIDGYDAALLDATAQAAIDGSVARAIKAAVVLIASVRAGKLPAALTAAEILAERTRFLNVYKTL